MMMTVTDESMDMDTVRIYGLQVTLEWAFDDFLEVFEKRRRLVPEWWSPAKETHEKYSGPRFTSLNSSRIVTSNQGFPATRTIDFTDVSSNVCAART